MSMLRLACSVWLASACGIAHADVYTMIDSDGTVRLSNVPDDPRYELVLREGGRAAPQQGPVAAGRAGRIRPREFDRHIHDAAVRFGVEPALVHAVIAHESAYNPAARSPKGAVGLMQVLPDTGRRYGVGDRELSEPAINIRTGTRYLAELLTLFGGNLALALASYNAGEHAVVRYGRSIPPYAETQAYVPRVLKTYAALRMNPAK